MSWPRRILLALAVVLVTATWGPPAHAWNSNRWRSPSGNIRCLYRPWNQSVTCATFSPRRSATLWWNGRVSIAHAWLPVAGPVLWYGQTVYGDQTDVSCTSWAWGMDCLNSVGGFEISHQRVVTW